MNILDLPTEVGILILNYLDTKSKINVYNSCNGLRDLFAPCHVKKLYFTRSTIATEKTLNEVFFINLRQYVQNINLSGVVDLTAEALKPHIHRLVQLKTLDITFTNIYLSDLLDICPTNLENISINFFKCPRKCKSDGAWEKCESLFKQRQFMSIHFIVFEFLDSDAPLIFLKDVPLTKNLQVTVADNYKDFSELDDDVPLSSTDSIEVNFTHLSYIFRDCRVSHKTSKCLKGVSNVDFNKLEYIFIMYMEKITVCVSPAFRSVFFVTCCSYLEVIPYLPLNLTLDGNIVFKAWNKDTTKFNDDFFRDLLVDLKDYFPTYVCMHSKISMSVTSAASDWFCIDSCDGFDKKLDHLPEKITLTDFCRKDNAVIHSSRHITLSPESKTLRNITFLRLSNICVKEDFFTLLFPQCNQLYTLVIYVENRGRLGMYLSLSRSIYLAKCLKNIKLISEDVEYEILFDTLSRCPTLENVHISEYERSLGDADVDVTNVLLFIEKCNDLYSLFIEADMTPEALTMFISPLREKAQNCGRDHLYIEVCDCYRGWNPFVDVFNPSPLHILE